MFSGNGKSASLHIFDLNFYILSLINLPQLTKEITAEFVWVFILLNYQILIIILFLKYDQTGLWTKK